VHLGNGRWYDPALGRPLQPNPAGGAPTASQSLNRYAAGVAGIGGAAGQNALSGLAATAAQSIMGGGLGKGLELGIKQAGQALDVGRLRVNPWRLYQLEEAGYRHLFSYHRQGWYISQAVQPVGDDVLGVVGSSERIALSRLRAIRGLDVQLDWPLSARAGRWLRGPGGEFLAAGVVELALALPQLNDIWSDPYYNPVQKWTQAGVIGGSSLASIWLNTWWATTIEASAIETLGISVVVGVGLYAGVELVIKPGISWVYTQVLDVPDPFIKVRNLQPLGNSQ